MSPPTRCCPQSLPATDSLSHSSPPATRWNFKKKKTKTTYKMGTCRRSAEQPPHVLLNPSLPSQHTQDGLPERHERLPRPPAGVKRESSPPPPPPTEGVVQGERSSSQRTESRGKRKLTLSSALASPPLRSECRWDSIDYVPVAYVCILRSVVRTSSV